MRPICRCLLTCLVLSLAGPARADDGLSAKVLEHIKRATVFVRVEAGRLSGTGSGFLFKTVGGDAYLITNHHVVSPTVVVETIRSRRPINPRSRAPMLPPRIVTSVITATKATINVVFFSGTKHEKSVRATVLGTDDVKDLALLKIEKFSELPDPIDISADAQPVETMAVYIIGFPLGELLSSTKGNPNITIGKGSVTSLPRNDRDELDHVQFDGSLNPGNSGGPVVDSQGRLIGVVASHYVMGSSATGINLAIPAFELTRLLDGRVGTPHVQPVSNENNRRQVKFELDLLDPLSKIKTVKLHYSTNRLPPNSKTLPNEQTVDLKLEKGKAVGELALTGPVGDQLSFQSEFSREEGKPESTPIRTLRLVNPQPATPGAIARSTLPPPKTPATAADLKGFVGYWPFDDVAGESFTDLSTKKHMARGENVASAPGIRGKAIEFKGPDSFVDLGDSSDFNFKAGAPFTITFWLKTKADSGTLLSFRNSKDDGADIDVAIEGGRLNATVRQDHAAAPAQVRGRVQVNDDQWRHCTLIRDGNIVSLFQDSQVQGRAAGNGVNGPITTDWRFLGREQRWHNGGQRGANVSFDGAIDELCIFQRALEHDEIRTLSGR